MLESILGDLTNSLSDFSDFGESITDYLSGYTSANQAYRFSVKNMAEQQQYNRENMALEDMYQRRLMADSPVIQRQALANAGFNPLLAISGGISSPNSASHAAMPSSAYPQVNSRLGEIVGLASTAVSGYAGLSKLASEVGLLKSQSAAASASALKDSALATKAAREADSIDPANRKERDRYGNGIVGEAYRFIRALSDGLGFTRPFDEQRPFGRDTQRSLDDVSLESADGIKSTLRDVESAVEHMPHSHMSINDYDLHRRGKYNLPR